MGRFPTIALESRKRSKATRICSHKEGWEPSGTFRVWSCFDEESVGYGLGWMSVEGIREYGFNMDWSAAEELYACHGVGVCGSLVVDFRPLAWG